MSSSSSTTPKRDEVTPRPSASLIVVNSRNEVLLVHRNPKASSYSGMHVFPGGNFDADQDASHEMTAIRETFEETGLLIASSASSDRVAAAPDSSLSGDTLDAARTAIHSGKLHFAAFLAQYALTADVSSLLPFTQWVTPAHEPKRFHTRFFVAFLPPVAPSAGFASGHTQQRLPTPDGGQEVIAARFVHPAHALAEFAAGRISLMPPQFYLLTTLAAIMRGREAADAERMRVKALAGGAFGRMVMHPQRYSGHGVPAGYICLTYDDDETRAGPKGRLHRSLVRFAKRMPIEIQLHRNFDVFTDILESPRGQGKL